MIKIAKVKIIILILIQTITLKGHNIVKNDRDMGDTLLNNVIQIINYGKIHNITSTISQNNSSVDDYISQNIARSNKNIKNKNITNIYSYLGEQNINQKRDISIENITATVQETINNIRNKIENLFWIGDDDIARNMQTNNKVMKEQKIDDARKNNRSISSNIQENSFTKSGNRRYNRILSHINMDSNNTIQEKHEVIKGYNQNVESRWKNSTEMKEKIKETIQNKSEKTNNIKDNFVKEFNGKRENTNHERKQREQNENNHDTGIITILLDGIVKGDKNRSDKRARQFNFEKRPEIDFITKKVKTIGEQTENLRNKTNTSGGGTHLYCGTKYDLDLNFKSITSWTLSCELHISGVRIYVSLENNEDNNDSYLLEISTKGASVRKTRKQTNLKSICLAVDKFNSACLEFDHTSCIDQPSAVHLHTFITLDDKQEKFKLGTLDLDMNGQRCNGDKHSRVQNEGYVDKYNVYQDKYYDNQQYKRKYGEQGVLHHANAQYKYKNEEGHRHGEHHEVYQDKYKNEDNSNNNNENEGANYGNSYENYYKHYQQAGDQWKLSSHYYK